MELAVDMKFVNTHPTKLNSRALIVCFAAALFFFYEFIQMNLLNVITVDLKRDLAINDFQYSWLSSMYFFANVIFLFIAGILLDRYSTKKIILSAMSLCVLGTVCFAVASDFTLALASRFLTGIGSAFCFVSCFRLASRWIPSRQMALITGLIVTFAMSGGVLSQEPFALLANYLHNWRTALLWDACLGVLIMIVIYRLVHDYPDNYQITPQQQRHDINELGFWAGLRQAYLTPHNIAAACYTSLMNMPIALLGVLFGGLYLQQSHHISAITAASITQWIFVGTILGGPVIGRFSDWLCLRRLPMALGTVISLALIMILLTSPDLSVGALKWLFFAIGFFTASQVIGYPTVAENNDPAITATAVSLVSILTQGGIAVYGLIFAKLLGAETLVDGISGHSPEQYYFALSMIPIGFCFAGLALLFIRETRAKPLA
jgi:MFS family permease